MHCAFPIHVIWDKSNAKQVQRGQEPWPSAIGALSDPDQRAPHGDGGGRWPDERYPGRWRALSTEDTGWPAGANHVSSSAATTGRGAGPKALGAGAGGRGAAVLCVWGVWVRDEAQLGAGGGDAGGSRRRAGGPGRWRRCRPGGGSRSRTGGGECACDCVW
jgi:hypothetical protein